MLKSSVQPVNQLGKGVDVLQTTVAPCNVKALKRCLEENGGNKDKCLKEVQAFAASCGQTQPRGGLNSTKAQ